VGFGAGISPNYESAVWIGNPANSWADKKTSPVLQVFYARQVLESVRLGGYLEYESATISLFNSNDYKASRYNIGINWLAQYPHTAFHAQLGGYIGYGIVEANDWSQSLHGSDVGIMVGPAYETNHIGVALHLQYGKAYYTSSGSPNEVGLAIPKLLLKVYYKF
jgi:squalene cyclase